MFDFAPRRPAADDLLVGCNILVDNTARLVSRGIGMPGHELPGDAADEPEAAGIMPPNGLREMATRLQYRTKILRGKASVERGTTSAEIVSP